MCEKCDAAIALVTEKDQQELKTQAKKVGAALLEDFEKRGFSPAFSMFIWTCAIAYVDDQMNDTQKMIFKQMEAEYYTAAMVVFMEKKYNLNIEHNNEERIN